MSAVRRRWSAVSEAQGIVHRNLGFGLRIAKLEAWSEETGVRIQEAKGMGQKRKRYALCVERSKPQRTTDDSHLLLVLSNVLRLNGALFHNPNISTIVYCDRDDHQ